MQTRHGFYISLFIILVTMVFAIVIGSTGGTARAQGPISTEAGKTPGTPPQQSTPLDEGASDSRKRGTKNPQNPSATFSYFHIAGVALSNRATAGPDAKMAIQAARTPWAALTAS